jgi:hypothetical protein
VRSIQAAPTSGEPRVDDADPRVLAADLGRGLWEAAVRLTGVDPLAAAGPKAA